MKNVRPDVEEGKGIAQRLSCYRLPSNLIVSQLMNVIAVEHDNGAFDSGEDRFLLLLILSYI